MLTSHYKPPQDLIQNNMLTSFDKPAQILYKITC